MERINERCSLAAPWFTPTHPVRQTARPPMYHRAVAADRNSSRLGPVAPPFASGHSPGSPNRSAPTSAGPFATIGILLSLCGTPSATPCAAEATAPPDGLFIVPVLPDVPAVRRGDPTVAASAAAHRGV